MLKQVLMFGAAGTAIGVAAGFTHYMWKDSGERLFPELQDLTPDAYDVVIRLSYFRRHDPAIFRRLSILTNDLCRLLKEKPYKIDQPAKIQAVASQVSTELRKLESVLREKKQLFDNQTIVDVQTFFDNTVYNVLLETNSKHAIVTR